MDETRAQEEINKYRKFKKVDGATYRKVNQFLRKRTYITAREWALARLCTDFRTTNGAEMTFIGEHLPQLVPFMEDTYSPQAVNQARNSFKKKVRKSSATFFYGAMCGFFTTEELDDLLFEASEVARFLLEVESTTLDIDEEIDIEDRITGVMRSVGEAAKTILKTRVMEAGNGAHDSYEKEPASPEGDNTGTPVKTSRRRKKRSALPEPAAENKSGGVQAVADNLPPCEPVQEVPADVPGEPSPAADGPAADQELPAERGDPPLEENGLEKPDTGTSGTAGVPLHKPEDGTE
jgi:hypothetical protein